ncbi:MULTISPECIES: YtxH domain-containing protein [unclassified Anabaena]|uniref:YtxH domain-containing protein n=1 Tax=unclassified Anabaena TaxID=2619674 RepID=UPI001445CE7F|nr:MULTISPECIES: YtxH domain-containing protein [unclassified Anabaena]MTJ07616.1 YtxH domain-containing protein [Anabaena sp. UHCC 0204]MTJ51416.1 YtxH domain-containing protein [Anabaena sp. UHCC 0253]
MSNNRSGIFIGGLMLGAAIGTLAGLLVAPRAGRETRKLIKKSANAIPELAEDISTSVQIQADRLSSSTLRNFDDTVDRFREAIAIGIDATQRESQNFNKQNTVDISSTADIADTLTQN